MAAVPIIKCTSKEQLAGMKLTDEKNDEKLEKKLTVLESHGYTLGKTIGAGTYATVKIAKSDRHNCQVAVKIVSKFQAPGEHLTKFLPREIEVVKGLKHPNLIHFLQAIETTHRVYIIMEYAQNGSLLDIIRRYTYIDELRSRRWFRQLLDAIDYCHEHGIVHRDVKCENLLMDRNFNIKLSDFGFARGQMKQTKGGQWPLSTTYCGSYAYASPEILRGIPYQPQLSDIWSMGVVLHAMVYGRLPFDDTNYMRLLKQVQNRVVFPKRPKVSQSCRSLIARILVPQFARLRINNIKSDAWLETSVVAQTSINDSFSEVLPTTPATKKSEDECAVTVTPATFQENEKSKDAIQDNTENRKTDLNAKL
ncbi:PREDICTED: testis-specific serine/threonine-protein kinase 4-like [Wasmannia auropunctata]|uniref:testis-specific serine/threonine-protein kinase 4-like n=1 Tax=Wasmannia auropunctata TaxID=64793 RepID=UPI0005EED47D|nr:PREDICTED: testis-specific serine/threonine-protein kinase 4-like [Wasmannia auropunctata]XP_011696630.1 PREDICTED: testis-specific serine/threonine-protein kinase 4-like [Wasmannia auropunctata]